MYVDPETMIEDYYFTATGMVKRGHNHKYLLNLLQCKGCKDVARGQQYVDPYGNNFVQYNK